MPTLFLSAPKVKTQLGSSFYRTFDTIVKNGIGPDYGIAANLIASVHAGMPVVVFDRDQKRCAEGIIAGYAPTSKAGNGVQRYNVQINNLTEVRPYRNPPKVNHFGVAIN